MFENGFMIVDKYLKNHCKCDLFAHGIRPDRHAPRAQHGVHVLNAVIWAPQKDMRCHFVGSARIVASGHNDAEHINEASSSPTVNRLARLLCVRRGSRSVTLLHFPKLTT